MTTMAENHRKVSTKNMRPDQVNDHIPGPSAREDEIKLTSPKPTVTFEGGIPIVSGGPINLNPRSFFVSQPYAAERKPKGPRNRYNDSKWNTNPKLQRENLSKNKNGKINNGQNRGETGTAGRLTTNNNNHNKQPIAPAEVRSRDVGIQTTPNEFDDGDRSATQGPRSPCRPSTSGNLTNHTSQGRIASKTGAHLNTAALPFNPKNKFKLPTHQEMLLMVDMIKKAKNNPPPVPPPPPSSLSSIADEFKKLVHELVAQDQKDGRNRKKVPMLDYYEGIYGRQFVRSPSPPPTLFDTDDETEDEDKKNRRPPIIQTGPLNVYDDTDDFALPNERPPPPKFDAHQLKYGVTVTIASIESFDQFIVFDHAGAWQLMELETEMNTFYGMYLMRKRAEYRELVFDIVVGGYYAVYLEGIDIWARCYVKFVGPPRPEFESVDGSNDPEQEIKVILIDYEIEPQTFTRKEILPLKKFFLHHCIQKLNAHVTWKENEGPGTFLKKEKDTEKPDLKLFREKVSGEQFHALIIKYLPKTEPLPTLCLELADPIYDF